MQKTGKTDNKVLITGLIVLGVIIITVIVSSYFGQTSMNDTISANGQSTVKVLPDLVSVYFNVQTRGISADEANDKNTEIVNKAKENLIALGFAEDEIKTQGFSVGPEYDWRNQQQKITGYVATHSLVVQISLDEKDKLGEVIDSGISAGAGISYINYELTEENQKRYKIEAIKSATEDATDKARALAEGAGQSLGKLVSISTSDFNYVPWMAYGTADSGGVVKSGAEIATSITPSEQDISASVTAIFRIR